MNQPLVEDDPRRLGSYDIVGRLGEGGQGVVYLGRAAGGEPVAVKLLHRGLLTDSRERNRFLREVELAQRVARFSTAPVLHADLAGRRPYIVSEYVPGPSLHDLVTVEGPRRGAALDRVAISTATALAAIHRAGILHGDFKPGNILMGPEGPVVIDFGVARALDAPGTTSTGSVMGTPSYLAPEQLGGLPVTEAADIFAWGVTMVFAASGRAAFGTDSTPAVINRILNKEPEISGLAGTLLELVTASLSKDPGERPRADDLVARLTSPTALPSPSALAASSALPSPSPLPPSPSASPSPTALPSPTASPASAALSSPARPPKARRRRTAIMAAAGVAAAALIVTGGLLINGGGRPVGSPPGQSTTSQSLVPSVTAEPTTPAQTDKAERRTTSAPAPRRTPPPGRPCTVRPRSTGAALP
ncbi:serine/threonine-protein kinase [Nonomuraea angiospora]|uniref:serine/threonine-protein kinase n=1 Tax=Nonomuraea angiospora TaxID=46172 RepID=UPI0029B62614|nr:serine/threonine-protein kinase [Nonomuraea angiospora]MDX3111460.1 serine/threonine-protein kinase [Nonomuraea angiospora]